MGVTDRELLVGVARGSDRAARELWGRHAGRLRAFLRALLPAGGPVDPDDVLQQTFCRILETGVSTLRGVEDVPAWLFQVARNIAFNQGRSERRERARRQARRSPDAERGAAGVRAGVLDGSRHDEGLARALGGLMPEMRDVVLLKHVAGLTFDQIAIATQTNRNTAASRYRAAMGLLERALAEPGHGRAGAGLAQAGTSGGAIPLSAGPTQAVHAIGVGAPGAGKGGVSCNGGPVVRAEVSHG
jgi:RNA polymerase sigma-70 factor (ECF subfamily)